MVLSENLWNGEREGTSVHWPLSFLAVVRATLGTVGTPKGDESTLLRKETRTKTKVYMVSCISKAEGLC